VPITDAASEVQPARDAGSDKSLPDTGDAAKDAPSACLWQDATVPIGGSVSDGCNTCACMTNGVMACTARACINLDASKDMCGLSTAVSFGYDGGMVAYQDQYDLAPSSGLTITRNYVRGVTDGSAVRTCAPALPACGTTSVVSGSTIVADLAAADVQSAFALTTTPIFGVDQRPVDGAVWSITLASGGTILVGTPCPSPEMSSCRPIPAGVQKLSDDLKSLATAAVTQPACAGL
jgi:Pacifastin inhibitor (LCMII)